MDRLPGWRIPLIFMAFLLPYSAINAWDFIPSAGVLLWLCGPRRLGLRIPRRHLLPAGAVLVAAALLGRFLILDRVAAAGLSWDPSRWSPWLRTRPVLQCLVEEMVVRSLLLGWLLERFPRGPLALSAATAAVFSALHVALYGLKDGVPVPPLALLTLFLFGLACNELWLRFRHLAFGYALHLGWNLTRFGGDYLRSGALLREGETYAPIEGTWPILGLSLAAAAIALSLNRLVPNRDDL